MKRVTVVIEDAHLVDVHLGDSLLGGRITMLADGDYSDLLEALQLADAALSGANMNMNVVERKVKAAIARARGEA